MSQCRIRGRLILHKHQSCDFHTSGRRLLDYGVRTAEHVIKQRGLISGVAYKKRAKTGVIPNDTGSTATARRIASNWLRPGSIGSADSMACD